MCAKLLKYSIFHIICAQAMEYGLTILITTQRITCTKPHFKKLMWFRIEVNEG